MQNITRGKVIPFDYPFTDPEPEAVFNLLFDGLKKFNPLLTQEAMKDIITHCIRISFKRNEIIVDYGERCEYVYFALKGLVTSLEMEDRKEYNCWFMSDGDVIIAIESFFMQTRSKERLVALEDTECIALHVEALNILRDKHPSFHLVELLLTRQYYQQAFNRTKWIRRRGTEKYQLLNEYYPNLTQRVTLGALASFLGVSRTQLYRIRRPRRSK